MRGLILDTLPHDPQKEKKLRSPTIIGVPLCPLDHQRENFTTSQPVSSPTLRNENSDENVTSLPDVDWLLHQLSPVPSPVSEHPALHHRHLICLYTMKARAQSAPVPPWRGDSDTPTVTIKDFYGQHYVPVPHSVWPIVMRSKEM